MDRQAEAPLQRVATFGNNHLVRADNDLCLIAAVDTVHMFQPPRMSRPIATCDRPVERQLRANPLLQRQVDPQIGPDAD